MVSSDLQHSRSFKTEVRKCQDEKLEKEVRNQRWQGSLVTARLQDEKLSAEECFWWLTEWNTCPTYTIAGYMLARRPIQVQRARRCAGCAARPQRALHTSCPGAVCWHDSVLKVLFYEMLRDVGLIDEIPPWYSPVKPKPVYESDDVQAYWDVLMFAEHQEMRSNRVDARIVNHKSKQVITLEMSCPWVNNREKKSEEKTFKYGPLRWELKQQFPGYEVQQHKHHHRCPWGLVTGDGHYDTRDGREQEQRGTEEDAEGGTVRHTQHCPNFQSCNLRNEPI